MPLNPDFEACVESLRDVVGKSEDQADGFAAIRHEGNSVLLLYAWGESARVVNRILKLQPSRSTGPVQ